MVIIRKKSKMPEAIERNVDWDHFANVISSKILIPKHVELVPKTTTNFHAVVAGNISCGVLGNSVLFTVKGLAITEISVGSNDVAEIKEISGRIFRLLLKNGLTLVVSN